MNSIEEIKHLFVPVSERLPDYDGHYYCLCNITEKCGNVWTGMTTIVVANNDWLMDNQTKEIMVITHWLDLSLLTTKERALKLAEDVFFEMNDYDKIKELENLLIVLSDPSKTKEVLSDVWDNGVWEAEEWDRSTTKETYINNLIKE